MLKVARWLKTLGSCCWYDEQAGSEIRAERQTMYNKREKIGWEPSLTSFRVKQDLHYELETSGLTKNGIGTSFLCVVLTRKNIKQANLKGNGMNKRWTSLVQECKTSLLNMVWLSETSTPTADEQNQNIYKLNGCWILRLVLYFHQFFPQLFIKQAIYIQ